MMQSIAEGIPKQSSHGHKEMLAHLKNAPMGLQEEILNSPLEHYLPADLLIISLRDGFYTATDRKVAKLLYKWRCGVLQDLVEWDFKQLQEANTPPAYVAKSLFYNKYGLGNKDILFIAGYATMKDGLKPRCPTRAMPPRWNDMEKKEDPKRGQESTERGRQDTPDTEDEQECI